jgi:hypothetical protein
MEILRRFSRFASFAPQNDMLNHRILSKSFFPETTQHDQTDYLDR